MSPNHALDSLVCGYSAAIRKRKVMVMITPSTHVAFVDESGNPAKDILLLSACINTYPAWANLSDEWSEALHRPPRIEAFHMRDARERAGEFSGWKTIDVDHKIISLTEAIVKHKPRILSCWISERDYAETVRASSPYDLRHAYYMCFCAIVVKVAQYQDYLGLSAPVDFVFDEKGDMGMEALLWYSAMRDAQPVNIQKIMGSTPVFRDDQDVLPLQAADLVAWHMRRSKEGGRSLDPELAATMRVNDLERAELHISRAYLEGIAQKTAQVPNVDKLKDGPSFYQTLKSQCRKEERRGKSQCKEQ